MHHYSLIAKYHTIGSSFPPTSGQILPTSGSFDWLDWAPSYGVYSSSQASGSDLGGGVSVPAILLF